MLLFHTGTQLLTRTIKSVPLNVVRAEGIIRNMNTLDAFKNVDKTEMIHNAARQVCPSSRKHVPFLY